MSEPVQIKLGLEREVKACYGGLSIAINKSVVMSWEEPWI